MFGASVIELLKTGTPNSLELDFNDGIRDFMVIEREAQMYLTNASLSDHGVVLIDTFDGYAIPFPPPFT